MEGDGERSTWTVWLHRSGGTDSRSFRFDPRVAGAVVAGALLVAAAAGGGVGMLLEQRAESRQVRELEARVQELRSRQEHVTALAARLDSMERAYRRMRSMLGADASEGAGPELPPSASGGDVPPAVAAGGGGLPPGWPLARPGFVTRRFRAAGTASGHPGLDVAVPTGSYVRAIADGTVREAGRDSVYGRFLRLLHEDGTQSLYGHASHLFAAAGDTVEQGQVIALSGNSGRSTAPHLHLEVRRDGRRIDPLQFLRSEAGSRPSTGGSGTVRADGAPGERALRDAGNEGIQEAHHVR
ncbi:MAG: peptidoglycan DD-metalloendopeptidase family protein [Candidatus Palauibacterales bacterium]|nr:peptidoglycan DD-metalloendopeptidase family protein [Candidatus Palauibacterales bacterium]